MVHGQRVHRILKRSIWLSFSSLYDQDAEQEEQQRIKEILKLSLLENERDQGKLVKVKESHKVKETDLKMLDLSSFESKLPEKIELQGLKVKKDLPSLNLPKFELNLKSKGIS